MTSRHVLGVLVLAAAGSIAAAFLWTLRIVEWVFAGIEQDRR